MEVDWLKFIPMAVSAISAFVSTCCAVKSKRMQTRLIENKSEIEQLNSLIESLKIANAIEKYQGDYDDKSFISGTDLRDVPSRIATLMQNDKIASKLNKSEWDPPVRDLDNKIAQLTGIRKQLI